MRTCRPPIALAAALLLAGCGYSIRPPFNPDVRTVYIPVVKSQSFRRDLNLELTDMLRAEIQNRTPFKVVGSPEGADTTLEATITLVDKNATVENPNNLPRQIMGNLNVQLKWIDNRLSYEKKKEIQPVTVVESVPFTPEIGETAQLGFTKALDRLVRETVGMMEEPW
jgi:hypothetical protein